MTVYLEQQQYMTEIITLLRQRGHCLLEMPSGTGKTISLLASTVSYQLYMKQKSGIDLGLEKVLFNENKTENSNKEESIQNTTNDTTNKYPEMFNPKSTIDSPFKIIYCSRTVSEIEKALHELKSLIKYIEENHTTYKKTLDFLGIGLTSRNTLCINTSARAMPFHIDHACNKLIRKVDKDADCQYYLNLEADNVKMKHRGVYTPDDLLEHGKCNTVCLYFLSRKLISQADITIFTYNYLIDPQIKSAVLREMDGFNNVVIFDEAHNINNACIEALSVDIKRGDLERANKEVKVVEKEIVRLKEEGMDILKGEYVKMSNEKLVDCEGGIPYKKEMIDCSHFSNNKETNKENKKNIDAMLVYEFAPGNIRNAVHFISTLKRLTEFFKTKLKTTHLTSESTSSFLRNISDLTLIDKKTLSFLSTRLSHLIRTLKLIDTDFRSLKKICDFSSLAAQYKSGFSVMFEPFDTMAPFVFSPILRLYCMDASIALKSVFKYRNVIITSGTLSPLNTYSKILDFVPVLAKEIGIVLERNCVGPLIVTKGNDQMIMKIGSEKEDTHNENDKNDENSINNNDDSNIISKVKNAISSSYSLRNDPSVIRNYGSLIIELSKVVPDGLVVFFPSYIFMEEIISCWCDSNTMNEIIKNKLVFIETPDIQETDKALLNYKLACENGRGAVLFSVARGKVSEGVDFKHEHGRCVVVLGVPYQFTESIRIKKRIQYIQDNFGILQGEFLTFDAMRQAAQCLGRVLRGKKDYGLMVLADYRFERADRKKKLPVWIYNCVEAKNCNLSVAKRFFREMAQEI